MRTRAYFRDRREIGQFADADRICERNRSSGPAEKRLGNIFCSVLAVLQKNLDRDASVDAAGAVGAADGAADRTGPVGGHSQQGAAIVQSDEFPPTRVPFDGKDARGWSGDLAHGRCALTWTGGNSPAPRIMFRKECGANANMGCQLIPPLCVSRLGRPSPPLKIMILLHFMYFLYICFQSQIPHNHSLSFATI